MVINDLTTPYKWAQATTLNLVKKKKKKESEKQSIHSKKPTTIFQILHLRLNWMI